VLGRNVLLRVLLAAITVPILPDQESEFCSYLTLFFKKTTLIRKVTLVTEDVEPGAAALLLETSIHKTASLTISAHTSTRLLGVPGKLPFEGVESWC
jgi:hypothetical protein